MQKWTVFFTTSWRYPCSQWIPPGDHSTLLVELFANHWVSSDLGRLTDNLSKVRIKPKFLSSDFCAKMIIKGIRKGCTQKYKPSTLITTLEDVILKVV